MPDFSFETPNLAAYERMLLSLGTSVARSVGRKAMRQGANVILHETRILAKAGHPAFPNKVTGLMAKSILTVDRGVVGDNVVFSVSVKRMAFYARFVEFGTSRSRAYPFMRPAAEKKAQESVEMMASVLGREIALRWGTAR